MVPIQVYVFLQGSIKLDDCIFVSPYQSLTDWNVFYEECDTRHKHGRKRGGARVAL